MFNFERHIKTVHNKVEYAEFMKEKEAIEAKHKLTPKANKRPSSSSSTSQNVPVKRQKKSESITQRSVRSMLNKDPVLNLCGAMVVENGQPFSNFDSSSMQVMMLWGMKGVGDENSSIPNAAKVRAKVQEEATELRKILKKELEGRVMSLSCDMASKDGRCFLGKRLLFDCNLRLDLTELLSFLGLNAQYFDKKSGSLKLVSLACREVYESHTAVHIRKWIENTRRKSGRFTKFG